MKCAQQPDRYRSLSGYYDLFELVFRLGGKGSPREGLLRQIPNSSLKVLEICVGTAANACLLAQTNPNNRITGIDLSQAMLGQAARKADRLNLPNLHLAQMDAACTGLATAYFDFAYVTFALHEIEDGTRKRILDEALRALKPGGRLLVVDFERQKGLGAQLFMAVWALFEPAGFMRFLNTDWAAWAKQRGLAYTDGGAFSFSRMHIFSKPEEGTTAR